jgi:hypothetical protein
VIVMMVGPVTVVAPNGDETQLLAEGQTLKVDQTADFPLAPGIILRHGAVANQAAIDAARAARELARQQLASAQTELAAVTAERDQARAELAAARAAPAPARG